MVCGKETHRSAEPRSSRHKCPSMRWTTTQGLKRGTSIYLPLNKQTKTEHLSSQKAICVAVESGSDNNNSHARTHINMEHLIQLNMRLSDKIAEDN